MFAISWGAQKTGKRNFLHMTWCAIAGERLSRAAKLSQPKDRRLLLLC
jgi:hypothetical protein